MAALASERSGARGPLERRQQSNGTQDNKKGGTATKMTRVAEERDERGRRKETCLVCPLVSRGPRV